MGGPTSPSIAPRTSQPTKIRGFRSAPTCLGPTLAMRSSSEPGSPGRAWTIWLRARESEPTARGEPASSSLAGPTSSFIRSTATSIPGFVGSTAGKRTRWSSPAPDSTDSGLVIGSPNASRPRSCRRRPGRGHLRSRFGAMMRGCSPWRGRSTIPRRAPPSRPSGPSLQRQAAAAVLRSAHSRSSTMGSSFCSEALPELTAQPPR